MCPIDWRQAISLGNDDKNLCCLEGTLDVGELIYHGFVTKIYQSIFRFEQYINLQHEDEHARCI